MGRRRRTCGFTLIELLVVIGIIGVLMTLLVPTVSKAMAIVRRHVTRSIITELEMGIEAFRTDFKVYPPSKPYIASDPAAGRQTTGPANLAYYLLGPGRSGWGMAGGGLMPFAGSSPIRSYGPYFQADEDAMAYESRGGKAGQVAGFLDAYQPAGVILYFAGRIDATGAMRFHWADCGMNTDAARNNYASQEYFEQCVMQTLGTGTNAPKQYLRDDFYLVSPGLDGRYGAIMQNRDSGEWIPTDLNIPGSRCDDIGNWKRTLEK